MILLLRGRTSDSMKRKYLYVLNFNALASVCRQCPWLQTVEPFRMFHFSRVVTPSFRHAYAMLVRSIQLSLQMCNALVPILQDVVSNLDTVSLDGSLHAEVFEPAAPTGTATSMKQYYVSELCYVYGLMMLAFFIFFNSRRFIYICIYIYIYIYIKRLELKKIKNASNIRP